MMLKRDEKFGNTNSAPNYYSDKMANLLNFSGSAADMLSAMKAAGMDVGTTDAQEAAIRVAG
jgi:hypothetical protein